MAQIIVAGHICLDITPVFSTTRKFHQIDELLEPGKLIHMDPANVHTGGCVANTGLALIKMGADVRLMGKVGADAFGGMVQQIVEQHGAGGLIVDEKASTSYSVVLAVPGVDRIFLHNPGANDTFVCADVMDQLDDLSESACLFHFGYPPLMKRMYENEGDELAELFRRVKEHGIATSLDFAAIDPESEAGQADWTKILTKVLPYVDYFVPSFEELCFMLNRNRYEELEQLGGEMIAHIDMERDVKPLADTLLSMGCKEVLIKCGTAGLYYQSKDKAFHQKCFEAEVVRSATGAGDTCIAAFLMAVTKGKSKEECVKLAAAQGAFAVASYDALGGIKTFEELEKYVSQFE